MTLWIQPLFGDAFSIPFSPTSKRWWKDVYFYLHHQYHSDKKMEQLRLFHNESADLSNVNEGDLLHLFVTDRIAERWISEYTVDRDWKEHGVQYHHSTLAWYDGRWGDPYENPSVRYRTSLTLHILVKERKSMDESKENTLEFLINPVYFKESYVLPSKIKTTTQHWLPRLRDACNAFREEWNAEEHADSFTEKTAEHIILLWELYHGTNQHLVDNGRYYDY